VHSFISEGVAPMTLCRLGILCLAVQFYGLLGGATMFFDRFAGRLMARGVNVRMAPMQSSTNVASLAADAPARRLNITHAVLNFFGAVLIAWYIVDSWGYVSIWWIWACFILVPSLLEGAALFAPGLKR